MTRQLDAFRFVAAASLMCLVGPAAGSSAGQSAASGSGQGIKQTWLFENRSYFDPAVAEIHAPDVTVTLFSQGSELQYATKPGRRPLWTISLGKEVPIFGRDGLQHGQTCLPVGGTPSAGCTSWGVWFAVHFHMMEDFKDDSNPIVDTDYRFGGIFKFQHAFTDTQSIGLRGYYGHESTHLGDEFALAAQRNLSINDFQRINVSYQYWEYGVSYNFVRGAHAFALRHLGSFLDPLTSWDSGYYSTNPLEVNGHTVTPSTNKYEPTVEFQWMNENALGRTWKPYVSIDERYRTVYDYAKADPASPDRRQWSTNLIAGFRRPLVTGKRGEPDFFARVYYGVNPYGQLRNQRDFFLFGVGFHVFV